MDDGFGTTYLVECFASTARDADVADRRARALGEAFADPQYRIKYVAGFALPDDEQVFLIVRGLDATSVRAACLQAGLTVERVAEVAIRDGWPAPPRPAPDRSAPRAAGCRR